MFSFSPFWELVAEGRAVHAVLHDAEVTRPGGCTFKSSGFLRWSCEEGPILEILDPSGGEMDRQRDHEPGTRIEDPNDFWRVAGKVQLTRAGRFEEPFDLVVADLTPEHEIANDSVLRTGRPVLLSFRPWTLTLRSTKRGDANLGLRLRQGVLQCRGPFHFDEVTSTEVVNPAGTSKSRAVDFLQGTLADGWRYWLHSHGHGLVRCSINGLQGVDFERRRKAIDFAFALGVGATCYWLCAAEFVDGETRLHLARPLERWRTEPSPFPPFGGHSTPMASSFRLLVQRVVDTDVDEDLRHHLRLLYLWWDACSATLQVRGLVITTILEALLGEADGRLTSTETSSLGPARRELLGALAASEAVSASPLYERLRNFVSSSLGNPRPVDGLHRLSKIAPALIGQEEIGAWKLRNKLAHGEFDPKAHKGELFRHVCLCANVVNKLVLALVGFSGTDAFFVDYSKPGWPASEFPWPPEQTSSSSGQGNP